MSPGRQKKKKASIIARSHKIGDGGGAGQGGRLPFPISRERASERASDKSRLVTAAPRRCYRGERENIFIAGPAIKIIYRGHYRANENINLFGLHKVNFAAATTIL